MSWMQLLSYEQCTWLVRCDPTAAIDSDTIERGASQPNFRKGDEGIAVRARFEDAITDIMGVQQSEEAGKVQSTSRSLYIS